MAGIFTRKAISSILNDEALTPEERTDQLFSLYGRAIDDGYVTKQAATAQADEAKANALKEYKAPDAKESEDYKALQSEYDSYKAMQQARTAKEFAEVKPKFFETVYKLVDRSEGAKPLEDQLTAIRGKYEEYFSETKEEGPKPAFGTPPQGSVPSGKTGPSFADTWGFVPQKG